MTDSHTTVGELREAIAGFVKDRSWERFHTPKNLAMSIAIEAAELMELFQWRSSEDGTNPSGDLETRAKWLMNWPMCSSTALRSPTVRA